MEKIKPSAWRGGRRPNECAAAENGRRDGGVPASGNLVLKPRAKLNRKEAAGSSAATNLMASMYPGIIIMNPFILFFIRAILGVAIAVVIARIFRGEASAMYVALGLAVILVGLAYALETLSKKAKNRERSWRHGRPDKFHVESPTHQSMSFIRSFQN